MRLPEFGVKRPVTNLMIFTGILVLALYSLTRLNIDLLPELEPPAISVIAAYPGASPEDVEEKVTKELEDQLSTTPGLEKITSYSYEGISVVTLKFIWGTNLDEASNDIRDRIELAKRFLPDIPDEMDNPRIFKFNTANIPILFIGVTAEQSYPQLYDLIDKRVADSLRQLPGVGAVIFQGGGLERQINIWIDKERLEGYGFSILDVENVLKRENITQPVGNIKSGLTDYLIRLPGEFKSVDEINLVMLGKRNGAFIYLKDVAEVEDSFKEVTSYVRINKKQGLIMMVQKQSGANTFEVSQRVKKRLQELSKTLPKDIELKIIFDTSKDIVDTLNNLKSSLRVAVILVILVIWFFLRRFTPSIIIALTIPFSLLISFIYLFLAGKTINIINLSALTIATGMVVDNAIVIVDNIFRRLEKGERKQEAAIFGASEMFLAVSASTLTTIVVFIPLLFIKGIVGKMFGELAIVIIVTLCASLFTALTFSPMLCSKLLKPPTNNANNKKRFFWLYNFSENLFTKVENIYADILCWCLRHKGFIILGFLGVFLVSVLLMRMGGSEFMPEEDSGDLRITISLAMGTRLEETDKVARRIEDIFQKEVPEARHYFVRSGQVPGMGRIMGQSSGTHIIYSGMKLVPKTERERSVKEVAQRLRSEIKKIPGIIRLDVSTTNPLSQLIMGGGGKSIQLEIIGHSFQQTDALAQKIKQIIENIPGAVDVSISREANRQELKIEVDREKAAALGLDMTTIASSVRTYIQGSTATKYREKGETYDIYVRLWESSRSKIEDIENLSLISPYTGKKIKLANITKIYETRVPEEITRTNRERVVKVECNTYRRSSGEIISDIQQALSNIAIPSDIFLNFGGEAEEQAKAFRDLFLLLILGMLLVYMVMAAQFESLLDPFIVMFAIPPTFIGVVFAFVLTHTTLSVMSYLGFIMLVGIVVNNAIVLISYTNILRSRGLSMIEAITESAKIRLRPVLMTTITTLVGLLPLAVSRGEGSESWQPLGITMVGGLSFSTFMTMVFIPTLYAIFERRLKKNSEVKNENGNAYL